MHRLFRLTDVDDATRAFEATNMCLRDDKELLERSLNDADTRWYANHATGYVRFVRRTLDIGLAWLLDVSYTEKGKVAFHSSSVTYMIEASSLLAQESSQMRLLYSDRQLARLFLRHVRNPKMVHARVLSPVTQPICKYRHDGNPAEEFSKAKFIFDEGVFYVL